MNRTILLFTSMGLSLLAACTEDDGKPAAQEPEDDGWDDEFWGDTGDWVVEHPDTPDAASSEITDAGFAVPDPPASPPPPPLEVSYAGPGCPAGTVESSLSDDESTFSVRLQRFDVSTRRGAGVPFRSNCTLRVEIHPRSSGRYQVTSVDYAGAAEISQGAIAFQATELRHEDQTEFARVQWQVRGPHSGAYDAAVDVPEAERRWSNCGSHAPLRVRARAEVVAVARGTNASMFGQPGGGASEHRFHLAWEPCP